MRERIELDQIFENCKSVKLSFTEAKHKNIKDILCMDISDYLSMFRQDEDTNEEYDTYLNNEYMKRFFEKNGDHQKNHTVGSVCQLLSKEYKKSKGAVDDEFFVVLQAFTTPFRDMFYQYGKGNKA